MWKPHEEQLRPRLIPEKQCSEQICEPLVSEQNEMVNPKTNEVPVSTPPLTPTKNTELSKSTQEIDTPEIDPKSTTPPRPQDADRQDLSTSTPLSEELTRRYPITNRKQPMRYFWSNSF